MQTRVLAVGLAVLGVVALSFPLQAQSFDPLFRIAGIRGSCLVKTPEANSFEAASKGKAYPFGTLVRTGKDSEAQILFSPDDLLRMSSASELMVSEPAGAAFASSRVVCLTEGRVDVVVRDGLPEKALVVESAIASCDSFAGRSSVEVLKNGKPGRDRLDLALVARADAGSLRVRGPQFSVPKLKTGSAVRIESASDRSVTRIANEAGAYPVAIENGTDTPVSLVDTVLHSSLRICREAAAVGGKLAVSALEIAPDAKPRNLFSFAVGDPALAVNIQPVLPDVRPIVPLPVATNAAATAESPASGDAAKKEEAPK